MPVLKAGFRRDYLFFFFWKRDVRRGSLVNQRATSLSFQCTADREGQCGSRLPCVPTGMNMGVSAV